MLRTFIAMLLTATLMDCGPLFATPRDEPTGVASAGGTAGKAGRGPVLSPLSLDPSFAGDGTLAIQIALRDYGNAGLVETSGEIVLFGDSDNGNPSNREGIMLRLAADGTEGPIHRFDASAFGCSVPRAFLTAIRLSNGDYLTGGYVQEGCGGIPRHFNVLQLAPNGTLQQEFDIVEFNDQLAYVFGLAEQADGGIIAVGLISGSGFDNTTYDFGVARYLPTGVLDPTFGSGGTFTFDLDGDLDYAQDVMIDAQGRILVVGLGTKAMSDRDVILLRLTDSGVLDTSFGTGGVAQYDRAGFNDSGNDVGLIPGGRIIVSGQTSPNDTTGEFSVLGFTDAGQIDAGFSGDGLAALDLPSSRSGSSNLFIDSFGRIYVTGVSEIGGSGVEFRQAVVAVLKANGQMDHNFNNGNARTFAFGDQPQDLPQTIVVDSESLNIVVSGYTQSADSSTQQFGVARLIGTPPDIFSDSFEGG